VTLADIYPTVGRMLRVDLPVREGATLFEGLAPKPNPPRLVVVLVWDGAGRNVLERWPDAWPTLARLEEAGTSYVNATVGSSPSITPSIHATIGTGTWPKRHGVAGIQYRKGPGVAVSFTGREPSVLRLPTFADVVDRAHDNEPKVGLVGWRGWHLGMLGHGKAFPGGDRDHLALIGFDGHVFGRHEFYRTPTYLGGRDALMSSVQELDASDGVADGNWRERDIATDHDNPAWVDFETGIILDLMRRERYGRDDVSDLLLVNYKMTDIVGHRHSMDSPEMEDVLAAQDGALGRLVGYLDRQVGDYALMVTSDHGHTPRPSVTGAWPIDQDELEADLNRHFSIPSDRPLTLAVTAVGPFLDHEIVDEFGVSLDAVARFLNDYTIGDNAGSRLPDEYESRRDERIFSAAFPSEDLGEVAECTGLR
jgi:hypothetical protein